MYIVVVLATLQHQSATHFQSTSNEYLPLNDFFDLALPSYYCTAWAFMFLAQYTAVAFQLGELPSSMQTDKVLHEVEGFQGCLIFIFSY